MKYRIVEYRPARYHVERRGVIFWRPLGRPPLDFVTVATATEAANLDEMQRLTRKVIRHFKRKVVKVL